MTNTFMTESKITNYLTIDVEDYYQVSAFEGVIDPNSWPKFESRVERNIQVILDLLQKRNIKATFFIVGWIAENYPQMVKKIYKQGHEIGCHSYWHRKVYDLKPESFREDTYRAKHTLEDIIGAPIKGYRAPSYSITKKSLWALDILAKLGFLYDSSIFPTYHDNYGIPDAPRFAYKLEAQQMVEFPISTTRLLGRNLPISGGGYFRLFPYALTRKALRQINDKEKKPFIFYLHPWEIDPDQPRVKNASRLSKFRHYVNLHTTQEKFSRLLNDFQFSPIANIK
ncbi:XrtA system polysaccharide deacetylase [uncultured Desulfosarcina sp.]|uniref:XrtA system polysaccharide deacetylase n=1 Tax=uncultured Desulfosarcina sp. TaxID=218289 RepID=UPI0029C80AE4|nr:XrtA system polysaccharide deacetylase [uncultured Desulfosarcina sp.]